MAERSRAAANSPADDDPRLAFIYQEAVRGLTEPKPRCGLIGDRCRKTWSEVEVEHFEAGDGDTHGLLGGLHSAGVDDRPDLRAA